jgi:predicted membrane protein
MFFGFILLVLGVLFLLDRMKLIPFGTVMSRFWPVILIVIGLWSIVGSRFRNFFAGTLILILGVLFQLSEFDMLEGGVWHYLWPVVIILLGLSILLKPAIRRGLPHRAAPVTDDELDMSVVFNETRKQVVSTAFRGGRISVVFGSVNVDLTGAVLESGKGTLDVSAVFAGVQLRVPTDWKLVIDASPMLGGVEDRTSQLPEAGVRATLHIRASTVLGGVEIAN